MLHTDWYAFLSFSVFMCRDMFMFEVLERFVCQCTHTWRRCTLVNWRCHDVSVFDVLKLFVSAHARGGGVHW